MSRIENITQKAEEINMNVLDIYQFQIVSLYNKAINIPNIRQMIYFLCMGKGYMSCINKQDGKFFVHLNEVAVQGEYQNLVIFFAKKLLRAYHERKVIELAPYGQWWKVYATFDCSSLSHEERGILTKILKQENKRLAAMGIKNRRQKRCYDRTIFLKCWEMKNKKPES